jgi:hypothetical protein
VLTSPGGFEPSTGHCRRLSSANSRKLGTRLQHSSSVQVRSQTGATTVHSHVQWSCILQSYYTVVVYSA